MSTLHQERLIKSRLEQIAAVRQWAADLARQAGFDPEAVFATEIAMAEALSNVVNHAYDGQQDRDIHIHLHIDEEKLSLTIRDFGRKFDPSSYTPPSLEEPAEGGYGVFLMREVMDEVTYDSSLAQGGLLNLVKYRPGAR